MLNRYRLAGLMAGITLGFAVWGADTPHLYHADRPVQASAQSRAPADASQQLRTVRQVSAPVSDMDIPDELRNLHAQSAVLIDADSGRILFGKNADVIRPMASTTKIMTCILALENAGPDTLCEVSSAAASQPRVHLGAPKGTGFYLKDLLYSLMLESHNDTAVMIAEATAGSVEAFAGMMNRKAEEIGCRDTCFITPNGLDAEKNLPDGTVRRHATTAADLAEIMRYCIMQSPEKEEFLAVTRTTDYSFSDVKKKQFYSCFNHNALLSMLPGALSGKTGFTGGAGYSYVGAYEDSGRTFIAALLGCGWPPHKTWKWEDARKLFSYGAVHYRYENIFEPQPDEELAVTDGVRDTVTARAESSSTGDQNFQVLLSEADRMEIRTKLPETVSAPVEKGMLLGQKEYLLNGTVIRTDPIFAVSGVEKRDFAYCLTQVMKKILLSCKGTIN